jgi:hypothetical protein
MLISVGVILPGLPLIEEEVYWKVAGVTGSSLFFLQEEKIKTPEARMSVTILNIMI